MPRPETTTDMNFHGPWKTICNSRNVPTHGLLVRVQIRTTDDPGVWEQQQRVNPKELSFIGEVLLGIGDFDLSAPARSAVSLTEV